ncbi:MAG: hypothetical protein L0170_12695 [Acidobacteria bacterium]|nr:hypothetical protein [Acidobacteriota bacterium]
MNELQKVEYGIEVPDFVKDQDLTGFIPDDQDILTPPRFKILSGMSQIVKEGKGQDGQVWSDAHDCAIGGVTQRKPLQFDLVTCIPLKWQRCWSSFEDGKILWQTTDPDAPQLQKIPEDQRWQYKRLMLVMLAPVGDPLHPPAPGVFSFLSTSFKVGRKLYGSTSAKKIPLYAQVWKMGIAEAKNDSGTWYAPDFTFAGVVKDPAMFASLQKQAQEISTFNIAVAIGDAPEKNGDQVPF